jgi:thymidylate kinase
MGEGGIGPREKHRPVFLSFSGIDGAGKSTQIDLLQELLEEAGVRVLRIPFWEGVAMFPSHRESASHALFKGDAGTGRPGKPINRRDKNVRSWYLTAARLVLYLFDALNLGFVVGRTAASGADLVIFDRYLYDELANLPLDRWIIRVYVYALLKLVPGPDIAYLLDADPALARCRKPEYPLDFLYSYRRSYLALSELVAGMKVISPLPIAEVRQQVAQELQQKVPPRQLAQLEGIHSGTR